VDAGQPLSQDILLGPNARLVVPGYTRTSIESGLKRRGVFSAGQIAISATGARGSSALLIDPRAVLDASGIESIADVTAGPDSAPGRYVPLLVDGAAGSIVLTARTGVLAGQLELSRGGSTGAAGTLIISAGSLDVRQSDLPGFGQIGPGSVGPATLVAIADRINGSGADNVVLISTPSGSQENPGNRLLFDGSVSLHAGRVLDLQTQTLGMALGGPSGAVVSLAAPYVILDGAAQGQPGTVSNQSLDATLEIQARDIDIINRVSLGCGPRSSCQWGGFGLAHFEAEQEIRFSDHNTRGDASSSAGLLSNGALEFRAAQVYASRIVDDPGNPQIVSGVTIQSDQSIRIEGNGNPAPVPFSYGSTLTLRAPHIDQGGVLRAPQGRIVLQAVGPDGTVVLEPGSITSASLDGLTVPFNAIDGQLLSGGVFRAYNSAGAAPQKSVELDGAHVSVQGGAVIDVSGGGDLLGYSFLPGNGGSRNVLQTPGAFAIIPSRGTSPSPAGGFGTLSDPSIQPGDTVWLQGVPGIPDGYYTRLPAQYALMPGGFLVEPLGGSYARAPATTVRADGAVIAAGYLAVHGTSIRGQTYGRYAVLSPSAFGQYSDLRTYSFNSYARDLASTVGVVARVPDDAGSAVINATRSLELHGSGRFGAGPGALAGDLDISAPNIAVVGGSASAPDPSYVTLDVQGLESFGAGSILLGGTRTPVTDPTQPGTAVTVNSSNVFVDTGGSQWTGPEILLAAKNTVTVAPGSSIAATGATSLDTSALLLTGDSALLRLSTGTRVPLVRTDVVSGPAAPGVGVLSVGAGTDLSATGSLSLYGSGALALAPDARLGGPQLDVASTRINLGDAPPGTTGATLGPDTIARLAGSSDLLIRGTGSIHLYPGLQLGGRDGTGAATLGMLTLDSPLLQADGAGGTSVITAHDLGIRNSGPAGGASAGGSGSTLSLDVDTLTLGPGQVQIAGFGQIQGSAGNIVLSGQGGLLVPGDISLGTAEVRALAGAGYELIAGGNLTLSHAPGIASTSPGAGARLLLSGSSVAIDTGVVLPGGEIEVAATSGAIQLGNAAVLDVHGTAEKVVDQERFIPGGTVRLSASGPLSAAAGASIDVSGDASGGNAGSITLTSGDLLSFDAQVEGTAGSGSLGGRISVDTVRITDLSSLNQRLELGGFTGERSYRLRQQDIVLGQAEQITAHTVVLQSDTGQVTIAGKILAAGTAEDPEGGRVRLEGGDGVALSGTAVIDAHAGAVSADGFPVASGLVELVASGGRISLAPGSSVDVSGGSTPGGGTVVARAPRTGNDLAIDPLQGRISASSIVAQGLATYAWSDVDATRAAQMVADASAWLSGAASIQARLVGGSNTLPPVVVAPAMAVSSSGDLTVHAPLTLSGLGPGSLRLSAGGSLLVQASVSDGFDSTGALSSARSFSLDLLAGQDVQIASGVMVRTGTGDIRLRAGRDIVLADSTSVLYTAGMRTANAPGFTGGQGDFPILGGSIFLSAGRDILAPFPTQSTSAWLLRAGAANWNGSQDTSTVRTQTAWSILYANFQSAVGALGGGNVQISAGRDVVQLQISIPTTGELTTAVGAVPQPGDLVIRGGGNLEVLAGRDILGGVFMLGQGTADIQAGRDIGASAQTANLRPSVTSASLTSVRQVAPLLGLMDASAKLTAGGSIDVEAVYDPMRQGQLPSAKPGGVGTAFVGYTDRTALEATAVSGDVAYENDPWASVDITASSQKYAVQMSGAGDSGLNLLFGEAPPTIRLASMGGNAYLRDRFSASSALSLASADLGNLTVLARDNVLLPVSIIRLGNVAAAYRRTALAPNTTQGPQDLTDVSAPPGNQPFIHAADPTPLRLYAEGGSVCAYLTGSCVPLGRFIQSTSLVANKPIDVYAGLDVVAGTWRVTGVGPDPTSRIHAGRDIVDAFVSASGPGTVVLEAGRDYVEHSYSDALQQGGEILSVGNPTRVPALPPDQAASILLITGTAGGVNYDGFASVYLDPANHAGVVRTYLPELRSYMAGLGISAPTDAALVARFQSLPLPDRQVFLYRVYFTELKETGIDYNNPDSPRFQSYQRGFDAVARLFPGSGKPGAKGGDVLLDGKPFETQAQGNITVLAPYGRIAVGSELASISSGGGIVTRRGGDIQLMADQNIDLFTSRVFTLQGGDITMWTSNGSITAGAGSKTSVLSAPLSYVTSPEGVVTVNVFGLQTGAGIGVLDALQGDDPNRKRSRLDLIAPRGEVNAGDAGIRVIGDLNIAAQVVVGVENIQVTGSAVGVPKVTQVNVAALTSASQLTQAAAKEGLGPAAAPRTTVQDLPSIITVEVVGYETTDKTPGAADEKKKDRKTR
jgi:hypothetical protein